MQNDNKRSTNWGKHYYRWRISSKKYYIIRRAAQSTGLFSLVNTTLGHIIYALNRGYLPVVDMKYYPSCYLESELIGTVNAWERLFEQPVGIDVDEAYEGRCVLLSDGNPISPRPDDDLDFFYNIDGKMDYWRERAHKYIRINAMLKKQIDEEYSRLFKKTDRVLGVLVRGTDYVEKKPYIHPVQPEPGDVIKKCKEVMNWEKCNKIFLATEDISIFNQFKKEFGDLCETNRRQFVHYEAGLNVPDLKIAREHDAYLRGVEYLTTISMLSKSYAFVGGRTSGSVGAMLLSDGYKSTYVFDLGRYGTDKNW